MRSRFSKSEFFEKMKKKPKLQNILDNIHYYELSELDKVDQPLWIREELKKYKKRNGFINKSIDEFLNKTLKDNNYTVYLSVYKCNRNMWLKSIYDNKTIELEIYVDDTIGIVDTNSLKVKIGSLYKILTLDSWNMLFNNCNYIDEMSAQQYAEFEENRLQNKHGFTNHYNNR